jgi:hypothetical protein
LNLPVDVKDRIDEAEQRAAVDVIDFVVRSQDSCRKRAVDVVRALGS